MDIVVSFFVSTMIFESIYNGVCTWNETSVIGCVSSYGCISIHMPDVMCNGHDNAGGMKFAMAGTIADISLPIHVRKLVRCVFYFSFK